jgi:hypothetical protein
MPSLDSVLSMVSTQNVVYLLPEDYYFKIYVNLAEKSY